MTATLFFVTNIVVLYNAYNREPQTWFCVIRQISRISKSGVFKGGISPSGLSPLALYADYPFIIRSYAIYIGQEKPPDGPACIRIRHDALPFFKENGRFTAKLGSVISFCRTVLRLSDRYGNLCLPGCGDVRNSDNRGNAGEKL